MKRKNDEMINHSTEELKTILQWEIASGSLKSAQRLVEAHLCERFQVKRHRIREVLRELEREGFVKIVPNVGAAVTSVSQKDIEQAYDLLGVLEGLAVRVITPFIKHEQLASLEKLLRKMESTDVPSEFERYNDEFHSLITYWSENDRLRKFTDNLRQNQKRFASHSFLSPGQIQASRLDHRRMFEAMKHGKPVEAERLMRSHLLRAKNRLIKYMNKSL
ncbi:MAG: GntR family transcriptional regulator [Thermodesulfobacteriota bacterium]